MKRLNSVFFLSALSSLVITASCTSTLEHKLTTSRLKLKETFKVCVDIEKNRDKVDPTLDRFAEVFSNYQKDELIPAIADIYDKDAFLDDRISQVQGSKAIQEYFSQTFDKIHAASFTILEFAYGHKEVFVNWRMEIIRDKGVEPWQFYGVSQLRFNEAGKIIFHFDHWDFSELVERIPVLGRSVSLIRSRS